MRQDKEAVVSKYGGDKFIWFLRKGGITRDPDFEVRFSNGLVKYIEFQYAKKELNAYDFKISKIAPKNRQLKKRIPKEDTEILYVIKPTYEFAFIKPKWIVENSRQTVAAAWGNAPVFRVNRDKFSEILKRDKGLERVCRLIDEKIAVLDFQHQAIDDEKEKLSYLLQTVIDENKIVKIIPNSLDGFFRVCFILDHLGKEPENANLWLVYLLSFINHSVNSYELFQLVYCIDFLYPRIDLKQNELDLVIEGMEKIMGKVNSFAKEDGSYQSDKRLAPIDDTRYSLFIINITEDLIQDILYYYDNTNVRLKPITRIYEKIGGIDKTFSFIQDE